MYRNLIKYTTYSLIPGILHSDNLENRTKTERKTDKDLNETGWDRVKTMYTIDEFGNVSYELHTILHTAAMSTFVGAVYGGFITSKDAYMEFMRNNEATAFKNHFDAKKKLQDKVTVGFARGAFRWGWRITLLSTTIVGVATTMQTYRNDYGISEYALAGGIGGALYKFNMGPKGWISGGVVGSLLGLIGGAVVNGILKMTGMSMAEARYWQYQWKKTRDEYYYKAQKKDMEQHEYAVETIHNLKIGEEGKNLSNLDKLDENK